MSALKSRTWISSLIMEKEKLFILSLPMIFLGAFLIIPLVNILIFSFWSLNPETGMMQADFTLKNYLTFFSNRVYLQSLIKTLEITVMVTAVSLLLGYPMAYFIAFFVRLEAQPLLMFLVLLPSWCSLLLRNFSWMVVLRPGGFMDYLLQSTGILTEPLNVLYTETAVIIGLIHIYLPFMILPIYSNLKNLDLSLLDAARTLGAGSLRAFLRVTLPLSLPGIITGVFLVALPVFGAFITPKVLGGTREIMIGNVIEMQFKSLFDWPFGAAVTAMMTLLLLLHIFLFNRFIGLSRITGAEKRSAKGS